MPVIRTATPIKPVKTERTHEENQERAYIAASRRSDRSLEARVESARRASEIHKKRTGRSLRVREEDVVNEEMYEEEDDDLPMQYRRINALNPHLSYAFAERLNNYVTGQIGVRTALQQAIAQSNQYQQNQQMLNAYMQQHGCYPPSATTPTMSGQARPAWPMNTASNFQSNFHASSFLYNAAQNTMNPQRAHVQSSPNGAVDAPQMPLLTHNTTMSGAPSVNHAYPHQSSHHNANVTTNSTASPKQVPSPPQSISTPLLQDRSADSPNMTSKPIPQRPEALIAPLTTRLPTETMQILDGMQGFSGSINPGYFQLQQPPTGPRLKYSYNPNPKPKCSPNSGNENSDPFDAMSQTMSPSAMHSTFATHLDPTSMNAAVNLDLFDMDQFETVPLFDAQNLGLDLSNASQVGDASQSGFGTPADPDAFGEFFDFQATPECET